MIYDDITTTLENEVFVKIDGLLPHALTYAKIESFNFAGSVKLKAALAMIDHYESAGELKPGKKVIESSSGNLGVALAMVCAARHYPFVCVTDPNAAPKNLALMKAYGAEVITVTDDGGDKGYVQQRIDVIQQMLNQDAALVWIDQYSNAANSQAHYQITAPAIHREVPDLDYLFLGVGSSGTLMGCKRYFAEQNAKVKLIAVDPVGSVLFGGSASKRLIPGIGGSCIPKLLDTEAPDDVVSVDEYETILMSQEMVKQRGWLVGGSTATALAGVRKYADSINQGAKVMLLAADFGANYLETIYNPQWLEQHFPQING